MKKIFSFALMLLGIATVLTSCKDDRDSNPTIGTPTKFVVNASPVAGQYIQLSPENRVNLTWSQPDYGYNALATYQIQVGLYNDGNIIWSQEDGVDKFLETTYTKCNADISGEEIAEAICVIDGVPDEEHYVDLGFREIAFRVKSSIQDSRGNDVAGTAILSNPVVFEHMAAYCAIKSLGSVYIIGNCGGWTEPKAANAETLADWRIYETEIGSKINADHILGIKSKLNTILSEATGQKLSVIEKDTDSEKLKTDTTSSAGWKFTGTASLFLKAK